MPVVDKVAILAEVDTSEVVVQVVYWDIAGTEVLGEIHIVALVLDVIMVQPAAVITAVVSNNMEVPEQE